MGPDTAQGAQIGNDGLGGGEVEGTPLQMAAMIATIANEGRAVQPSLVTAVRRPGSHRTESVTGAQSQRLSPAVADAVRTALTDVASPAAGGTARTLAGRTRRQLYLKTGTHELLKPDQTSPPGMFARQIAWVVGFFATTDRCRSPRLWRHATTESPPGCGTSPARSSPRLWGHADDRADPGVLRE